jgi:hypothetical protein
MRSMVEGHPAQPPCVRSATAERLRDAQHQNISRRDRGGAESSRHTCGDSARPQPPRQRGSRKGRRGEKRREGVALSLGKGGWW